MSNEDTPLKLNEYQWENNGLPVVELRNPDRGVLWSSAQLYPGVHLEGQFTLEELETIIVKVREARAMIIPKAAEKLSDHAWLARFRHGKVEMSPEAGRDIAGYIDRFIKLVLGK